MYLFVCMAYAPRLVEQTDQ